MKTLPIILPIITCIVLLSSCNNSPKKSQPLVEAKVEIPSDPNLLLATELMENADNDLSTLLAAAYFYSLVPEESIAMDSIHQQNIDMLQENFHLNFLSVTPLVQTIYSDVEVDQTSAGNLNRIGDIDYYFQPYKIGHGSSYQNVIYNGSFYPQNIQQYNMYYYTQTNLVHSHSGYDYYFYYVSPNHPLTFQADSILESYHVDTTFQFVNSNDTLEFDRFVSDDAQLPMFFHPRTQIHYHAPCKIKPNTSVVATASNRIVKVVDGAHSLNGKEYRMVITPPDCTRMTESTLETDTFKIKLAKVYYLRGGVEFPLDTIAYFPEAL